MDFAELIGHDLGSRRVRYTARDAMLYALAVGARPEALDLVYERDLRVLPSYGCALGLWAVEAAGALGAYDRTYSLHAAQSLTVHRSLPTEGDFEMWGRVGAVWDKGKATIVEIAAECEFFSAGYTIFLPGRGGWGGERGPASHSVELGEPDWTGVFDTWPNQAAIYRLTGDLHPIHIDPAIAGKNGFDRPILHGLCTLGIVARMLSEVQGAHPSDLIELNVRLTAPLFPGDRIDISASTVEDALRFEARAGNAVLLKDGTATFGNRPE